MHTSMCYAYEYMVVSILFTYTNPFTAEKSTELLLLCHSLQDLNGPNTLKFLATTKTVFVKVSSSKLWEKTSKADTSYHMQADIFKMLTLLDDTDSAKGACGRCIEETT